MEVSGVQLYLDASVKTTDLNKNFGSWRIENYDFTLWNRRLLILQLMIKQQVKKYKHIIYKYFRACPSSKGNHSWLTNYYKLANICFKTAKTNYIDIHVNNLFWERINVHFQFIRMIKAKTIRLLLQPSAEPIRRLNHIYSKQISLQIAIDPSGRFMWRYEAFYC